MSDLNQRAAKTDAVVALVFIALFCWSVFASYQAAADAVRRYGHNVDSGAVQEMVGVFYFAPVATLFALAALVQWRNWRAGRYVHHFAFAYLVAPPALAIVSELRRAL